MAQFYKSCSGGCFTKYEWQKSGPNSGTMQHQCSGARTGPSEPWGVMGPLAPPNFVPFYSNDIPSNTAPHLAIISDSTGKVLSTGECSTTNNCPHFFFAILIFSDKSIFLSKYIVLYALSRPIDYLTIKFPFFFPIFHQNKSINKEQNMLDFLKELNS